MAYLRKSFTVKVAAEPPILVGQDEVYGRRQLIVCPTGTVEGDITGTLLPGAVDSQVIRPDSTCELSARYALALDGGGSVYIQNDGIRTVPDEYVEAVKAGQFVDPNLYYFCTTPRFEVYSRDLDWLTRKVFVCSATRHPDSVEIVYYSVEQGDEPEAD